MDFCQVLIYKYVFAKKEAVWYNTIVDKFLLKKDVVNEHYI